jgi:hypothetical protein
MKRGAENWKYVLYARLEPSADASPQALLRSDIYLYFDREATKLAARRPWHHFKPARNHKTVVFKGMRYDLVWIDNVKRGGSK